ncbi:Acetyltransferase (GNAT) family protein [Chitinophaga costaii]|uniref:Acetyltransferase (GNAT) family protein n=1 Tax=Chitinophaga costaii TaxID=1335309 RepID=A0A1C4FAV4_9BACT|nr:GNAT family N-acetyltransferase [Chitinophaga costaii]PUZ20729.1 N-acetyltransferase [Chitinophaga costaii]SCC52984.1 Acetyltransferase (GNAT) family protein [Chitinophaga costaii]
MAKALHLVTLTLSVPVIDQLAALLIDTVAHGGSVSFMHPLSLEDARAFWHDSLAAAHRGERVVLGAYDGDILTGTLTLLLECPPNQPHRAELAKMMTALNYRGQGIAKALVEAAERIAKEKGKTLLNLDTAAEDGAAGLYEKLGYIRVGKIPGYALKPLGGLTGTIIYYKYI